MNRAYLDRRLWLRGAFAAITLAVAAVVCTSYEVATRSHGAQPVQFLFESVQFAQKGLWSCEFHVVLPAAEVRSGALAAEDILADGIGKDRDAIYQVREVTPIYANATQKASIPTSVVMLFDQSASLHDQHAYGTVYHGSDNDGARFQAAKDYIGALPSTVRVAILSFSGADVAGEPNQVKVRSGFTTDKAQLLQSVATLQGVTPDGETPLFSSLKTCLAMLRKEPQTTEKRVLTLTDGDPTGDFVSESDVRGMAIKERVKLDFIALGGDSTWQEITDLSTASKGKLVKVGSARNLVGGFAQMASQLHRAVAFKVRIQGERDKAYQEGERLNIQLVSNPPQSTKFPVKQYAVQASGTQPSSTP